MTQSEYQRDAQARARAKISSPCVQRCGMHPVEEICTGCYRSLDEIMEWATYSEAERHRIMDSLPSRADRLTKYIAARRKRRRRNG